MVKLNFHKPLLLYVLSICTHFPFFPGPHCFFFPLPLPLPLPPSPSLSWMLTMPPGREGAGGEDLLCMLCLRSALGEGVSHLDLRFCPCLFNLVLKSKNTCTLHNSTQFNTKDKIIKNYTCTSVTYRITGIFRVLSFFRYSPCVRKLKQQNVIRLYTVVIHLVHIRNTQLSNIYLIQVSFCSQNIPDIVSAR